MRSVGRQASSFAGEPAGVRFCEEGEIGIRGFVRFGCISKNDFFRGVLLTGLQDEAASGVNSYKMGVIASTDGHISTAGDTHEHGWPGHLAAESVGLQYRWTTVAGDCYPTALICGGEAIQGQRCRAAFRWTGSP